MARQLNKLTTIDVAKKHLQPGAHEDGGGLARSSLRRVAAGRGRCASRCVACAKRTDWAAILASR